MPLTAVKWGIKVARWRGDGPRNAAASDKQLRDGRSNNPECNKIHAYGTVKSFVTTRNFLIRSSSGPSKSYGLGSASWRRNLSARSSKPLAACDRPRLADTFLCATGDKHSFGKKFPKHNCYKLVISTKYIGCIAAPRWSQCWEQPWPCTETLGESERAVLELILRPVAARLFLISTRRPITGRCTKSASARYTRSACWCWRESRVHSLWRGMAVNALHGLPRHDSAPASAKLHQQIAENLPGVRRTGCLARNTHTRRGIEVEPVWARWAWRICTDDVFVGF